MIHYTYSHTNIQTRARSISVLSAHKWRRLRWRWRWRATCSQLVDIVFGKKYLHKVVLARQDVGETFAFRFLRPLRRGGRRLVRTTKLARKVHDVPSNNKSVCIARQLRRHSACCLLCSEAKVAGARHVNKLQQFVVICLWFFLFIFFFCNLFSLALCTVFCVIIILFVPFHSSMSLLRRIFMLFISALPSYNRYFLHFSCYFVLYCLIWFIICCFFHSLLLLLHAGI